MKAVLEAFIQYLKAHEIPALVEPESLETTEPFFRLGFTGFDAAGKNREQLSLTGTLTAQGDGPDYFLDSVIEASRKLLPLRERAFPFTVSSGVSATATMERTAPGRFQENEEGKYHFSYIEVYRIELTYNPIHFA